MKPDTRIFIAPTSARPLIGVTTSEVRYAEAVHQTPQGEPPRKEMALGLSYMRAIALAGGSPVVMPPLGVESVPHFLARVDGLCLSGGPDLEPGCYGETPHAELGPVEPDLDHFELAAARAAHAMELPVLAICRGAQALNVAHGGTLHQHLPALGAQTIDHRQRDTGEYPTHHVEIDPASRLAAILGTTRADVNSFHHQAVARLGRGLRAVAWAPDSVIEAIECSSREFEVGVQWHAESLCAEQPHSALFGELIAAAQRYASGQRRAVAA